MLTRSWDQVSTTRIVNRFRKGKMSVTSHIEAINDSDDPFSDLKYQLDELTIRDSSLLQGDSAESFVYFDNDIHGVMTEEKYWKKWLLMKMMMMMMMMMMMIMKKKRKKKTWKHLMNPFTVQLGLWLYQPFHIWNF